MRRAVTIAQDSKGKWATLAYPEVPIKEQKILFKQLKEQDGQLKDENGEPMGPQYREALIMFTPCKCHKFGVLKKTPVIDVIDDLLNLAEDELKAVIKDEELEVKFSKDHEKTRAAIRKAREKKAAAPKAEEPPPPPKDDK